VKRLRGEHVAVAAGVVGTGRRIEPDGDTFSERFPLLGARIYQTTG
jgi:hypothetical protein